MTYITYGVKVVCVSNKGEETQEFLYHIIDPNVGVAPEECIDEYWIQDVAAECLEQMIDDGELEESNDILNDWTFVVKYGVFRVAAEGSRLAVAEAINDVDNMLAEMFSEAYH
jgi:hypothetical protein